MRDFIAAIALGVAGFLALPGEGKAERTGQLDLVYAVTMSRLELGEVVLRSAADFWSENPSASGLNAHLSLRQILNGSDHFRSLLAISEDGVLAFDSFNPLPFLGAKDLSDRAYWREASSRRAKELVISPAVVGRQSGIPFIPLAMAVPGGVVRGQKVLVLTAEPEALLPSVGLCNYCGATLLSGQSVIASTRPLSEVNERIIEALSFDGLYGAQSLSVRGMAVQVHWRKSEKYDLTVVYYEVDPRGE